MREAAHARSRTKRTSSWRVRRCPTPPVATKRRHSDADRGRRRRARSSRWCRLRRWRSTPSAATSRSVAPSTPWRRSGGSVVDASKCAAQPRKCRSPGPRNAAVRAALWRLRTYTMCMRTAPPRRPSPRCLRVGTRTARTAVYSLRGDPQSTQQTAAFAGWQRMSCCWALSRCSCCLTRSPT